MNNYNKYIKYKNKYIYLKNKLNEQTGGDPVLKDDELYRINLFKIQFIENPYNRYKREVHEEYTSILKEKIDIINDTLYVNIKSFINSKSQKPITITQIKKTNGNINDLINKLFDLDKIKNALKTKIKEYVDNNSYYELKYYLEELLESPLKYVEEKLKLYVNTELNDNIIKEKTNLFTKIYEYQQIIYTRYYNSSNSVDNSVDNSAEHIDEQQKKEILDIITRLINNFTLLFNNELLIQLNDNNLENIEEILKNYKIIINKKLSNDIMREDVIIRENYRNITGTISGHGAITNFHKVINDPKNNGILNDMEEYLNPINGLYMFRLGYLKNIYNLHNLGYTSEFSTNIIKLFINLNDEFRLNALMLNYINNICKNIGQNIAILYLYEVRGNKFLQNLSDTDKKILEDYTKQVTNINSVYNTNPIGKIINSFVKWDPKKKPTNKKCDEYFNVLLYCLWWVATSVDDINQYYDGLNDVFKIANKYLTEYYKLFIIIKDPDPYTISSISYYDYKFERLMYKMSGEFKIIQWLKSNAFCNPPTNYSDCGETAVRNLINLLCYDKLTDKFDINILNMFNPINDIINYYTVFNTFEKQITNKSYEIFNDKLNARDAWSYIVINHNNNLVFSENCNGHGYDLRSGLNIDNSETNLFQLVKNLFNIDIESWDTISRVDNIKIEDRTTTQTFEYNIFTDKRLTGVGNIIITHTILGNFFIECTGRHYEFKERGNNSDDYIDYSYLNESQIDKINLLKTNILNNNNYLFFKLIPTNIVQIVKLINRENDFLTKKKMIKLLATSQIFVDDKKISKINIDVDTEIEIIDELLELIERYPKIYKIFNKINYICTNFDFLNKFNDKPPLKDFSCTLKDGAPSALILKNVYSTCNYFLVDSKITEIIINNLKEIKPNFMFNCENLIRIDFNGSIKKISSIFMCECINLTYINFGGSVVTKIEELFMYNCSKLESILNLDLSQIVNFPDRFLYKCTHLLNIDFNGARPKTIGYKFLSNCYNIIQINNLDLSLTESIDEYFLNECNKLEKINDTNILNLQNLKKIEHYFMFECSSLQNINELKLELLTSIGNYFMSDCTNLQSIDGLNLELLTSIGDYFMLGCFSLQSINQTNILNFVSLSKIGDSFMENCNSIINININFYNIDTIPNYFLYSCISLMYCDINTNIKFNTIGIYFLSNCIKLKSIYLDNFMHGELTSSFYRNWKSTNIGDNFMADCTDLINIFSPIANNYTYFILCGDNFLANTNLSCTFIDKFERRNRSLNYFENCKD